MSEKLNVSTFIIYICLCMCMCERDIILKYKCKVELTVIIFHYSAIVAHVVLGKYLLLEIRVI
jgi:hypothetical protein